MLCVMRPDYDYSNIPAYPSYWNNAPPHVTNNLVKQVRENIEELKF